MNTQEKSMALAKLMGWSVKSHAKPDGTIAYRLLTEGTLNWLFFEPYTDTAEGRAQFAAILLKFPKVIMQYAYDKDKAKWLNAAEGEMFHGEPTQESLLDEILRMNGVLE